MVFSPNTIARISALFDELNWFIDIDNPLDSSVFNRFCSMISNLDLEQQELVFELTKRFLVIKMPLYMDLLKQVIYKINSNDLKENIFFGPLVAPQDFKKTKSSVALMYYCREFDIKYNPKFTGKKLNLFLSAEEVIEKLKTVEHQDVSVILVDDFIGTGQTAHDAVEFMMSETGISNENIIILSIACQEIGEQRLLEDNIKTLFYYKLKRGISDYYQEPEVSKYKEIMKQIEVKMRVSRNLKFGYGGSESLIAMSRTPNNTFPIFWLESKKKNRLAPFPRD